MAKTAIVLHHSDILNTYPQAERIIKTHLNNPKIKQSSAYHYLIERNGEIVQFHDEEFIGYHSGNWLMNVRSIGICLGGDFTREKPTESQIFTLVGLVTDIQRRWGIPLSQIFHHRDVKATLCPAYDLRGAIEEGQTTLLAKRLRTAETALSRPMRPERRNLLSRLIERLRGRS